MKYPTLFDADEISFSTHGLGVLSDAVSCLVRHEINGRYELEMKYPAEGVHLKKLVGRALIYADAGPGAGVQPFRIYAVTATVGGYVKVLARHISYDLVGIPVSPFSASNSSEALQGILDHTIEGYEGSKRITATDYFKVEGNYFSLVPRSARARLLDPDESLLATYGGEYEFDHFEIRRYERLGSDKGYRITYGVNLLDLSQEKNFGEVYTAIYPYYNSGEDYFELPEKVVNIDGNFSYLRVLPLDLSSRFEEMPSEEKLREATLEYIKKNEPGEPKVSITLTHAELGRTAEYSNIIPAELCLGDTVRVSFPRFDISAASRVTSVVWDSLSSQYSEVHLGDILKTFTKTVSDRTRPYRWR